MGILRHLRNLLFGNGDSNNNEHRDIAPQQNDGQSATTQVTVESSPDRQARGDDTNARTQAVDTDDDATEASVAEATAATEQNHDSDATPPASTSSRQPAPSHTDSTESENKPEQDVVPSSEDVATDSSTADTIPDTDAEDSQQASGPEAASTDQSTKETSSPLSDSATTSDADETDTPNQPSVPTADFAELSAFQRDLLFIISGMETPKGLEIKEELEGYYGEDINHGRLYPNLDTLAEEDLIEKVNLDGRSNGYNITDTGRAHLAARRTWVTTRLHHQTSI